MMRVARAAARAAETRVIEPRTIRIVNARVHNLQGVSCAVPRGKLTVVTGPSGSGKSSLVFDTIWAEAQRRYTETLPSYVRQVMGVWEKPAVEAIENLSPAVALDARPAALNPRSTVGTASEIHDYLRVLFARAGVPHCVRCGDALARSPREAIIEELCALPEGTRVAVTAPLGAADAAELPALWSALAREGFVRVVLGDAVLPLDEAPPAREGPVEVAVIVDRLAMRSGIRGRVAEAVETALLRSGGLAGARIEGAPPRVFSERYLCARCGTTMAPPEPAAFSFNNPEGACPRCRGLGVTAAVARDAVLDPALSLAGGAVRPWRSLPRKIPEKLRAPLEDLLARFGAGLDTPLGDLPDEARQALLLGGGGDAFPGLVAIMTRAWERRTGAASSYVREDACPECNGARLRRESLAVKVGGLGMREICELPLAKAAAFFEGLPAQDPVAAPLVREILRRLGLLCELGLGYVALGRGVPTLSAGEYQRLRLAMQIGAGLAGILYVLDEPTVGLHPSETERLIAIFRRLCAQGSTVLIVEHDLDVIRAADHVLDLGPGAGPNGGRLVAAGTPAQIAADKASLTGRYLAGRVRFGDGRRRKTKDCIEVRNARAHNLKDVAAAFPLRALTCVTGPSGSGKSSLLIDTLYRGLRAVLAGGAAPADGCAEIEVRGTLAAAVAVDQSPVGRSARSTPATYAGFFGPIREFFAKLPLARMRGWGPDRFSFNTKGGRCEICQGEGVTRVAMQFLPDIAVPCGACGGRRFNSETLDVRYRGLSIADVLACSVGAAMELFSALPRAAEGLRFLAEIGLGYLTLGQRADTLSGGEAQRLKLSRELARVSRDTVYVLDEPTTGLHLEDIRLLHAALRRLVAAGNTVIVIEHGVEFIAAADHVIDMGPGGGEAGGRIVACGTPEELAADPSSPTGAYLRRVLGKAPRRRSARRPAS